MDNHPLTEILELVRDRARKERVLAVFDLDSTLFCVSPRTQTILRELGLQADFKGRYPDAASILADIEIQPTDWGIREALERSPLKPAPGLIREIRDHWRARFFSNDYLHHDTIYPDADVFVRGLAEAGAHIRYLTGRNRDAMERGTLIALGKFGFPLADPAHLIMKPSDVMTDDGFKRKVLSELSVNFDHVWFFENEPVIINEVHRALPMVHIVHVRSTHSRKAEAPDGLRAIGMSFRLRPE